MIQEITDAYNLNLKLIVGRNTDINNKLLQEFENGIYILSPNM